jgi:predicted nucleotidyltransferase
MLTPANQHPVGYGWKNCPEPVNQLINDILRHYQTVLGDNITGFYLHGSLAMDCFNPLLSDLDFLAIVRRRLKVKEKRAIIGYLLTLSENSPVKGVEMSIVREKYLRNFVYPTPFELHYSNEWYERYQTGQVDYSGQNSDEDLAAHFVMTRERGVCLFGKPTKEMFPEIPRPLYVKSLLSDAQWLYQQAEKYPLTATLNLCRILAFLKANKITSKKEGAKWALSNLPQEFSPLIVSALRCYSNTNQEEQPDIGNLPDFMEYARQEINFLME